MTEENNGFLAALRAAFLKGTKGPEERGGVGWEEVRTSLPHSSFHRNSYFAQGHGHTHRERTGRTHKTPYLRVVSRDRKGQMCVLRLAPNLVPILITPSIMECYSKSSAEMPADKIHLQNMRENIV